MKMRSHYFGLVVAILFFTLISKHADAQAKTIHRTYTRGYVDADAYLKEVTISGGYQGGTSYDGSNNISFDTWPNSNTANIFSLFVYSTSTYDSSEKLISVTGSFTSPTSRVCFRRNSPGAFHAQGNITSDPTSANKYITTMIETGLPNGITVIPCPTKPKRNTTTAPVEVADQAAAVNAAANPFFGARLTMSYIKGGNPTWLVVNADDTDTIMVTSLAPGKYTIFGGRIWQNRQITTASSAVKVAYFNVGSDGILKLKAALNTTSNIWEWAQIN